ncbi:MAG: alanine--tRNA ligase [Patescibacteria group bacterium]
MKTQDIRKKFLAYFVERGHARVPSSSLLPSNDPTVLLTSAGMQQFKPYFSGDADSVKDFGSKRLTSIQRCFRTSDIESVGDATHLTFFEMLGNFSIGNYFKKEAIDFAIEFLTKRIGLSVDSLCATYFKGENELKEDDEAKKLLADYFPENKIFGFGTKDNWWGPTGSSGPCGPCVEIHVDVTKKPCERGTLCIANCECGRFLEIWNLVFTEFNQSVEKVITPLASKNIDTGMGVERLALVTQHVADVFTTDEMKRIIAVIQDDEHFGKLTPLEDTMRCRIVADHMRGVYFLLGDGVRFSNKEQGYILRRLFRRACDQFLSPHFDFRPLWKTLTETYKDTYPEIATHADEAFQVLLNEEKAYKKILKVSVDQSVQKFLKKATPTPVTDGSGPSSRPITPQDAFTLYSTYGISPDRLKRAGYTFSLSEFEQEVEKHQHQSREGSEKKFGGHGLNTVNSDTISAEERWEITKLHTATHLLHQALRIVLGEHVRQQGSDITAERLRFDFEHPAKLTDEQKKKIEDLVNSVITQDMAVSYSSMSLNEAIEGGALSFFREKYPPTVTVYTVGDFSKEICGGPHVEHTGQIGHFSIESEKSSSAGIRRIKATVKDGSVSS